MGTFILMISAVVVIAAIFVFALVRAKKMPQEAAPVEAISSNDALSQNKKKAESAND